MCMFYNVLFIPGPVLKEVKTMIDFKNRLHGIRQRFSKMHMVIVVAVVVATSTLLMAANMSSKVSVVVDGNKQEVKTYKSTVKDVLASLDIKISDKDKVLPGLDSKVKNSMTIEVKRAVPINVKVDGKEVAINTSENTVQDMIKSEGIVLNEKDKILPGLEQPIQKDMEVKITRVVEKTMTSTEVIAFQSFKKSDDNLEKGETKVLQDGVDGEKEVVTKVVYEDGKEVSKSTVSELIKKTPVDKIVAFGTLSYFIPSRGSNKVLYTRKLTMKATSYTVGPPHTPTTSGITASGMKVNYDPNGYSTVAVDPRVIPLGTKLYVVGYGYAIAADTGGAVKGNVIDLYFSPDKMGKGLWSTRQTVVYVLK